MPQAKKSNPSSNDNLDEDWRLTAERRTDSAHLMGYGYQSIRDANRASPAPISTSWIPDPAENQATSEPVASMPQPPPKRSGTGSSTKSFSSVKKLKFWKSH